MDLSEPQAGELFRQSRGKAVNKPRMTRNAGKCAKCGDVMTLLGKPVAAPRTLTATSPEPVSLDDMGTDGQKWAQAFVDRFGGDEGLMIGWFANAIEAGRTAGMASGYPIEQPNLIHDGEATPQREVHTRDCGWRVQMSRCSCDAAIDGEA